MDLFLGRGCCSSLLWSFLEEEPGWRKYVTGASLWSLWPCPINPLVVYTLLPVCGWRCDLSASCPCWHAFTIIMDIWPSETRSQNCLFLELCLFMELCHSNRKGTITLAHTVTVSDRIINKWPSEWKLDHWAWLGLGSFLLSLTLGLHQVGSSTC